MNYPISYRYGISQMMLGDEAAKTTRLSLQDGTGWGNWLGRQSYSGKTVSIETALQLAAVWACVKVTAQAIASLPKGIVERQSDGSRVPVDHPIADIVGLDPNIDQTAEEFWEHQVAWLLLNGNAYSHKRFIGNRLVALDPLKSTNCTPVRNKDGELVYRVRDRGQNIELPRDEIFHLRGFSLDRDMGMSAIRYGVQTLGNAMATDETSGKMFGNGLQATGVLSVDQVLKPDQRVQLQEMMESFVGSTNAGKLMVLESGMKYDGLQINPEDAQMLETKKFNVEDVCRWFGTPPIIIGHAGSGQTMWGKGVEQIMLAWLTLGINPLARKIESRIRKQLLSPADRKRFKPEFNREVLLQMDSQAKAAFLSSLTQNGLMSRNEGRDKLNLPRRDGADELTVQTALAPIDELAGPSTQKE